MRPRRALPAVTLRAPASAPGRVWMLLAAAVAAVMPGLALAQELLAARTLRPGTVVAPGDVVAPGLAPEAAEAALDAVVGLETRVAIYAGRPIRPGDLGPPTLVRRNAVVTILYRRGGLEIRTEGRALGAGGLGERVPVLNTDSRRTIEAVIVGADTVTVSP